MIFNHNNDSGLQKQIDELNQSLTTRYNEETDYLEALVNGVWKQAIYLGLIFNGILYESGKLAEGFSFVSTLQYRNGTYATKYKTPNTKPIITKGASSVTIEYKNWWTGNEYNGYTYTTVYIDGLVNLSDFKFCDIEVSLVTGEHSSFQAIFTKTAPTTSSTASVISESKTVGLANGVNTIDISSLSDKQYLALGCNTGAGTNKLVLTKAKFYN